MTITLDIRPEWKPNSPARPVRNSPRVAAAQGRAVEAVATALLEGARPHRSAPPTAVSAASRFTSRDMRRAMSNGQHQLSISR